MRAIPVYVAAAIEIVAEAGGRAIRMNDLDLRMHQRGFDARAVTATIRALERRNWIESIGSTLVLREVAFQPHAPPARRRPKRMRIPDLF